MKSILVIYIAMLFIFTTFAGASGIKIRETNDPVPTPATNIPPGLWNTAYESGGKISLLIGQWKHVEKDEEVTYKSEISFYQFGGGAIFTVIDGQMVMIPGYANRIDILIEERKDGGSWYTICEETITSGQAGSNGHKNHRFTKSYSEDGTYEVEVSATSYGETIAHGEISWGSGGGKLYTMTTAVGSAKSKAMPFMNLPDMPIFQLLYRIFNIRDI